MIAATDSICAPPDAPRPTGADLQPVRALAENTHGRDTAGTTDTVSLRPTTNIITLAA